MTSARHGALIAAWRDAIAVQSHLGYWSPTTRVYFLLALQVWERDGYYSTSD